VALEGALAGKRVLIVGGGGIGIGRGITEGVGAAGAAGIVVVGRTSERAEQAALAVASGACRAMAITADVRSAADAERVVAATRQELGGIDAHVTVVGGMGLHAPWNALDETTNEDWDLIFDINLNYVFRYVRACLKVFLAQPAGGVIVSIGSISAFTGTPMAVAYGAAKAALVNMARSVAAEYGRRGIRMNVINCGRILSEAGTKTTREGVTMDVVPMGRSGTPEEVANLAVFFASSLSSFITGQAIAIDGGVTSRAPFRLPNTDTSMAG
jgi:3-oxoacyl-[acyl-carrier protein] reductase